MKKILYIITQSEFGGAQRYVFDLANNLKADFQTAVVMGEQGKNETLAKILTENNIKYYIIPHLKRSISPLNDVLALIEIIKLIKQFQPDIIHLNSSKISIIGSIAAFLAKLETENRKLKTIYTVHGWVFNEPLSAWLKYFYLWAEKFTASFKDKIICVSEHDRQTALRYKIAPASKLVTIHNGLAFRHSGLDPESSIRKLEQLSGLRVKPAMTGSFLIGSIGYLYKTKGFKYFIQAADILVNQNHIPATFIIIGGGSERKNLENLIAKYNLQNNFILAGPIEEASKLLPAFDIYVCSSVKEGLPYSILEAMSAGRPIVSTSVGGISEILEHKKTGLLSKPAEANALAENIKLLMDDKTLRDRLGARAQEKVKTEFSLEKMVEQTKNHYS